MTPSWVSNGLLTDVNAQVQITATATGILVQLAPQLAEQLNVLFAGDSLSVRDRVRSEFDRLKDDPSLTPEQKQQLQNLQSFFNAGVKKGYFQEPGGADTVVGGGDSANTPVVFALTGIGATGAGTAAGAAGAAGLNGASGTNQGYRDPESGQWVGGSPPLTLPSIGSLEQLAATNPVIGNIYRTYVWMAGVLANAALSENGNDASVPDTRVKNPSKQDSPIWNDLENSGGGTKTSGTGSRQRYYEWDYTHNDIEVYDKNGRHLGSMNPSTGEIYKPPVPGRKIKK